MARASAAPPVTASEPNTDHIDLIDAALPQPIQQWRAVLVDSFEAAVRSGTLVAKPLRTASSAVWRTQ